MKYTTMKEGDKVALIVEYNYKHMGKWSCLASDSFGKIVAMYSAAMFSREETKELEYMYWFDPEKTYEETIVWVKFDSLQVTDLDEWMAGTQRRYFELPIRRSLLTKI